MSFKRNKQTSPVYKVLPNAHEHPNEVLYVPQSTALPIPRNREREGLWVSDGEKWTRVNGLSDLQNISQVISGGDVLRNGIISGGLVSWITGMDFYVTACNYWINGKEYNSPNTIVTLSNGDATYDRIDLFVVDDTGSVVVIEGTPSSNPLEPSEDGATQIKLTSILVQAGITSMNIARERIYDENLGSTSEWDASSDGTFARFDDTQEPLTGTIDIWTSDIPANETMSFVRASVVNLGAYTTLIVPVKASQAHDGDETMILKWYEGTTLKGSLTVLNGQYGWDTSKYNSYQQISIPIQDFNLLNKDVDKLTISFTGVEWGMYMDKIELQYIEQPVIPEPEKLLVSNTLFVDAVYGIDSTGERENPYRPYKTAGAAEAAALSGDTIRFRPGSHTVATILGKEGVSYHILPNAKLNVTAAALFGIYYTTITIINEGHIECDGVKFISKSGGETYLHSSGTLTFKNVSYPITIIAGKLYSWTNSIEAYGNTEVFNCNSAGAFIYASFNRIYSESRVFTGNSYGSTAVDIVAEGNYVYTTINRGDDSWIRTNDNCRIRVRVNYAYVNISASTSRLIHLRKASSGTSGTVWLEGEVEYNNGADKVIDLESNGSVYLRNLKLRSLNAGYNGYMIYVYGTTNEVLHLDNVELINENTGSGAGGIQVASGTADVDLRDVVIKLDATAVSGGAKSLRFSGGTLNLRVKTDIVGSGGWEGTNLIPWTMMIKEPNL